MSDGHGPSRCDLCSTIWIQCRCPGPHDEKVERCPDCKAATLLAGTPANIKHRRLLLEAEERAVDAAKMRLVTEFTILQRDCRHPKKRRYSAQGEVGEICDDCGWQR